MALSGTIYSSTHAGGYRLELEWSATQSVANNTSTITATLYWHSLGSGYPIYSSATKSGRITIDGNNSNFSGAGLAALKGNQRKKIHSYTRTITHNSDGKRDVTLSAYFDVEIQAASWIGRVSLSQRVTLNTIPRKSTMTTSRNFTAGSNRTITISRHSSSFRHEVELYVKTSSGSWDWIKQVAFSTSQTSLSTSFTSAQNEEIFQHLNGRASAEVRMDLQTFSGSTHIGTNTYYGTVTAPAATTAKITNPTGVSSASGQGQSTVWIDQSISISLPRANSGFTHTVRFKDGNGGTTIHTATGVGTSYTWTPTQAEKDKLYTKAANTVEFDGEITVETFYGSRKVRSYTTTDINYRVRNSNPSFSGGMIYRDINTTTLDITGNNQYVIQNKSSLRVEIPESAKATAVNKASMSHYDITVNGKLKRATYKSSGSVIVDFGVIEASSATIIVKAVDSRGFSITRSKQVTILPYKDPVLSPNIYRVNSYETNTRLSVSGSVSPLVIGGVSKNSIVSITYQYKRTTASSYSAAAPLSPTGFPNFATNEVTMELSNVSSWHVRIAITDSLGTTTIVRTVDTGKPILFIDPELNSLGFGDYPQQPDEFRVNGRIVFGANMWSSQSQGEGAGALFLNNSDITGVNGIFFNDQSNNKGEGLLFLKSGSEIGSTVSADYDSWYIRDGSFYLDNQEYMKFTYGNGTGSAIAIGAGGLTIIGGGESATTFQNGHPSWGPTDEQMIVTNDYSVWIVTNLQDGYSSRQEFQFSSSGDFSAPRQVNSGPNLQMNGYNTVQNLYDNLYLYGHGARSDGTALAIGRDTPGQRIWSMAVYNRTYSSAANLHITSAGTFGRSTSASKYKLEIAEAETDEIAERLLLLQPKKWYDKGTAEAYSEYLTKLYNNENVEEDDVPYLQRHYGLIAEDLIDVGLDMFVSYGAPNEEGIREVEGIEYDRVWTLLIPIVRKDREEIKELKATVSFQKEKIDILESRVTNLEEKLLA